MNDLQIFKVEMEQNVLAIMKSVTGMTGVIRDVTDRIDIIETTLSKRVYISSVHANLLKKAVNIHAKAIIEKYGLDYKKHSRKLYSAIYRALHDKFSIADYREIPDVEFDNTIEFIRVWEDELFLNRLKSDNAA